MIKNVFVRVTNKCNMNCPFCYVDQTSKDSFNKQQIIDTLNKLTNCNFILFGGEPLLVNSDDLLDIVNNVNGNWSITTNLTTPINNHLTLLEKMNNGITISYDLIRPYTKEQLTIFHKNIDLIRHLPLSFSSVLTPTLTEQYSATQFCLKLDEICELHNIFPQIILNYCIVKDDTTFNYEKIDKWLCLMYNYYCNNNIHWNCTMFESLINGIPYGNFGQCNTAYVNSDGTFFNRCLHNEYKQEMTDVLNECLSCKYNSICMGSCGMINKFKCNAPRHLYDLILYGDNNGCTS